MLLPLDFLGSPEYEKRLRFPFLKPDGFLPMTPSILLLILSCMVEARSFYIALSNAMGL